MVAFADLLSQLRPQPNMATNPNVAALQQRIAQAAPTLAESGTGVGNAQTALQGLSDLQGSPAGVARQGLTDLGEGGFMTPQTLGNIGTNFGIPLAGGWAGSQLQNEGTYELQNNPGAPGSLDRLGGVANRAVGEATRDASLAFGAAHLPLLGRIPYVGGVLNKGVAVPAALAGGTFGALHSIPTSLGIINSNETAEGRVATPQLEKFNQQLVDNAHKMSDQDYATIYKQARASLDPSVPAAKRNAALKDLNKQFNAALAQPGSVGGIQQPRMNPNTIMQQQLAISQMMAPWIGKMNPATGQYEGGSVQGNGQMMSDVLSGISKELPPEFQAAAKYQAAQQIANSNRMAAAMAQESQTLPYANQIYNQNAVLSQLANAMYHQNQGGTQSLTSLSPTGVPGSTGVGMTAQPNAYQQYATTPMAQYNSYSAPR